ncbi:MAG TPA: glycosyltransferase family 39 protein, partial [Terriglobales bacterium]
MNSRLRIPDWIFLLAFCAFFFLWRLASFGLIGADEPRYAQVAREMLARHDWVTPTLSGVPWLEKPPLYYWQAMISYRIFGVSDWAARLPAVVDATLLVLAAYWFLRRLRAGIQLDGALILA